MTPFRTLRPTGAPGISAATSPSPLIARRTLLIGAAATTLFATDRRSLFDGSSAAGWRAVGGGEFPSHCWNVEAGCLHSLAAKPPFEDIGTIGEFEDFELEFEWKIAPGGNSGVKYLIFREDPARHRGRGFEYQLADDEIEPDAAAHPESRSGALYGFVAPLQRATKAVGEFNMSRIVRRGFSIEHWMNGVRVVHVRLDSEEIRARMRARKVPIELPVRSPIVLQNHGSEAWFRNLRIRF